MCSTILYFRLLLLSAAVYSAPNVSELEYFSMPPVFHLDDYERCMSYGKESIYCSITFQLYPENASDKSDVWKIIEKVNADSTNYRHDILRHGICVTDTCKNISNKLTLKKNLEEITVGINACYNAKYQRNGLRGEIVEIRCENQDSPYPIGTFDVLFAFFAIVYVAWVAFASLYEGVARYRPSEEYNKITGTPFGKIVSSFSIPNNWIRFSTDDSTKPESGSLRCINGMRFICSAGVLTAHSLFSYMIGPISNTWEPESMMDYPEHALFHNGSYICQVFFLLSGFLLCYQTLTHFESKPKIKPGFILKALAHRFLRLTPALAVVVGFHSTAWYVKISRGPVWDSIVGSEYRRCRENWWATLLNINNYVNIERMCQQQTWYLSADTQLFLIALAVVILIKNYEKHAKSILGTTIVASILITAAKCYIFEYDILARRNPEDLYHFLFKTREWREVFIKTECNITGCIIGVACGYIFYKTRGQKLVTGKIQIALWWFLSFVPALAVVISAAPMYHRDFTFTPMQAALYWALGPPIFAFSAAVLLLGLTHDIDGWVAKWLVESRLFFLLGRLTYSVYLVHVFLQKIRAGNNRHSVFYAKYIVLHTAIGDMVASYLLALVFTLVIEMPISAVMKYFMEPNTNLKKQKSK